MIRYKKIDHQSELDPKLRDLYESSFPADERRDWDDWMKLLDRSEFSFYQINKLNTFIGFITLWQLNGIVFPEHFSILPEERGNNYGTEAIEELIRISNGLIILEVEEPFTEQAQRRIAFYRRCGFFVNQEEYYQPAYNPGKNKVKLLLMSYPQILNGNQFNEAKKQIHTIVYNSAE